mmetsp:Transcript_21224/g.55430  ORF Transcript_21224/g.55430 Transcript_21224/m.55430 type:complete len:262 (+) Transcript_21224:608-1393(+)
MRSVIIACRDVWSVGSAPASSITRTLSITSPCCRTRVASAVSRSLFNVRCQSSVVPPLSEAARARMCSADQPIESIALGSAPPDSSINFSRRGRVFLATMAKGAPPAVRAPRWKLKLFRSAPWRMSASRTGPQQARAACGNMLVASCGSILDIFSRTPSSTALNSSSGERISVRRHVRPMCSAPCEAMARNFSFVMMMPAPRYMSSICCICFLSASGIVSIQLSPAASFPSSPGTARFIFAVLLSLWGVLALSAAGAREHA